MAASRTPYYVKFLGEELARRKARNPRYSLRAFAAYLGMDPSAISRILTGKQELSLPGGIRIARKLNVDAHEKSRLLASIAEEKSARAALLLASAIDLTGKTGDENLDILGRDRKLPSVPVLSLETPSQIKPRAITDFSSERIAVFDSEGRILFANGAVCFLEGKEPCELIGTECEKLSPALSPPSVAQIQGVFAGGKDLRAEARSAEGWHEVSLVPVLGHRRQVKAVVWKVQDVTSGRTAKFQFEIVSRLASDFARVTGFSATLDAIGRALVPALSECCVVNVLDQPEKFRGASVTHVDPERQRRLSELLRGDRELEKTCGFPMGAVQRAAEMRGEGHDSGKLREFGFGSMICAPMISRDRIVGSIILANASSAHPYGDAELRLAEKIAWQSGVSLDSAVAYELSEKRRPG